MSSSPSPSAPAASSSIPISSSPSASLPSRSPAVPSRAEAIGRYRAANLSALRPRSPPTQPSATSNSVPSSSARRPRAGTMPSSLGSPTSALSSSISALRPGLPSARPDLLRHLLPSSSSPLSPSSHSSRGSLPPPGLGPAILPPALAQDIHHPSHLRLSLDKPRARAGTVALPPSSASSYFGRGVFSTNFVPRTTRMNEELRSGPSDDSGHGPDVESQSEAGHVRTLDYLGLDGDSPNSPALPHPPQSAFASSAFYNHPLLNAYLHPSAHPDLSSVLAQRLRASTISGISPSAALNMASQSSPLRNSSLLHSRDPVGFGCPSSDLNSPALMDEDLARPLGSANSMASQYAIGTATGSIRSADPLHAQVLEKSMATYSGGLLAPNNVLLHGARPRATTLAGASLLAGAGGTGSAGNLSPAAAAAAVRHRAGTLAGLSKHNDYLSRNSESASNTSSPYNYVSADNMSHWLSGSGPMTPDLGLGSLIQPPSKTIWVGNLDPSTTAQELMGAFSVYGAIESLCLLPEKQCGFINFVSIHDAVHAKDDVVNRLEGQISLKNGPALVRIGFGEPEAVSQTPAGLLGTPGSGMRTPGSAVGGLAQAMMLLSLNNARGPNGSLSTTQINNIYPNPGSYTTVGGVIIGPNGDPVLQSTPTRALWIGSIPPQTTPNHLMDLFSPYGAIESARVLTHKNCGFVNFEHLDDAVRARKALNGREVLGSEVGTVKIGYAKVPVKTSANMSTSQNDTPGQHDSVAQQQLNLEALAWMRGASSVPLEQQLLSGAIQDYRSNLAMSLLPSQAALGHALGPGSSRLMATTADFGRGGPDHIERTGVGLSTSAPMPAVTEMQLLMRELCYSRAGKERAEEQTEEDDQSVAEFRPPVTYYTSVPPPINQLDPHRRLVSAASDPARLREIRKRMDANGFSQEDMDQLATELMDEIVYLSSDYIGNTIVQKFFEKCSQGVRMVMLDRCAPHLAVSGCHKNGTWAAQKIIDTAIAPEEMKIICQNLRPFGPPLLLDSLGNYVMQCCLRFGSPLNDFVFDSIVDRCWEVAQGRFGARSVRTCLESKYATRLQIKKVAVAIILNSVPLATNPNGTLLLTWLLDTSGLPGRFKLLAPRLAPHLSHLCTHKLALVTVLKVVNQDVDPDASKVIIEALFHSASSVLQEVLGDQVHGVGVLSKIFASPFVSAQDREMMAEKVKEAMVVLRVQNIPAYKKLAEEMGVSAPGGLGTGVGAGSGHNSQLVGAVPPHQATPVRSAPSPGAVKTWGSTPPSATGGGMASGSGGGKGVMWSSDTQFGPGGGGGPGSVGMNGRSKSSNGGGAARGRARISNSSSASTTLTAANLGSGVPAGTLVGAGSRSSTPSKIMQGVPGVPGGHLQPPFGASNDGMSLKALLAGPVPPPPLSGGGGGSGTEPTNRASYPSLTPFGRHPHPPQLLSMGLCINNNGHHNPNFPN